MKSERRCGYCRDSGHIKRNCEELHSLRRNIFDHTITQRKSVYNMLVESGYGVGALVAWKSYNFNANGIIITHADSIPSQDFFSYRRIKYTKQVRVAYQFPQKTDYHYAGFNAAILGGGVSTVSLPMCSFYLGEKYDNASYGVKILSPSNDYDERVSENTFYKNIIIPERLQLPCDKVGLGEYDTVYLLPKNIQR